MPDQKKSDQGPMPPGPTNLRNPFILNFCKVLVEKKDEKLEPDVQKRLIDDMYRLYENMLGQNMVKALPEDVRKEYLAATQDLETLNYDKIGACFDKSIKNHEEVMKETLKEFTELFIKNRNFNPNDYSVDLPPAQEE